MHIRIVWGKVLPGQWDAFEAAYKKALEIRGEVKGLKCQWLLQDQNDPDAGYSISQWESDEDMRTFWDSRKRSDAMAVIQPFFVNQFTITNCVVKVAVDRWTIETKAERASEVLPRPGVIANYNHELAARTCAL